VGGRSWEEGYKEVEKEGFHNSIVNKEQSRTIVMEPMSNREAEEISVLHRERSNLALFW
jgi:hypothetical protein